MVRKRMANGDLGDSKRKKIGEHVGQCKLIETIMQECAANKSSVHGRRRDHAEYLQNEDG